ncbi:MAG: hypothetical protein HZA91_09780 [Verrucomicrobia bacterium]|nr:hypothetical protein [Verrucomicrobiota bacterium]
MKRLFAITIITLTGMALPMAAQVRLEVKPVTSKKDVGGVYGNAAEYVQSRSLAINIQNTSAKPILGITVRWGIVKMNQGGYVSRSSKGLRSGQSAAFGGEESVDLKPLESKRIETSAVEAGGRRWNYLSPEGEKLVGHGVQVLIGDKVMAEEFVPPTVKNAFKELRPVGSDRDEDGKGSGKSKR